MAIDWQNIPVLEVLAQFWNFKIAVVDKNPITVGAVIIGAALFFGGVRLASLLSERIVSRILARFSVERSSKAIVQSVAFYALSFFFALFALKMANVPLTAFTLFGGAIAIGVGFGSQNILNNFISGLILMFEQPVKVGDFVEVDGIFGEVEQIGVRSTSIRSYGNRHIIVPNSSFLDKNVINWTRLNDRVRLTIEVGVAYGSDVDQVIRKLTDAVSLHDRSIDPRNTEVFFRNFGESALDFELVFWAQLRELNDKRRLESDIRITIDRLFREAGITIAFPQRDVHFDSSQPIRVDLVDSR